MKTEKIKKIFEQFKIIFQKFPLTFITTIVLTLFFSIEADWTEETIIIYVSTFGFIFAFSSFFIESTFNSKPLKYRIVLYVVSTIISLVFTIATNHKEGFLGLSHEKYIEYVWRFLFSYILSIFVYSIYSLYKNKNLPINEYLVKTTIYMFKNTLIYGILTIGLSLIGIAFITLILEGEDHFLMNRIHILLFGLFYIPNMFFSFTIPEDEIGKFAKIVIKYVLGTLIISVFAVIYIYILKILIQWKIPSNEIFRITTGLFVLGCPIWILVSYFKDNDMFEKINNKLPYAFIPFIFLQIYSIGVRIFEYGITPTRYICVAFIIFEIIYLIIYHLDKENLRALFYSLIAIILVSGLFPFINMFKLSEISQLNNIKAAKYSVNNIGRLTDEQYLKAMGAYSYLSATEEGKALVDSVLSQEEKKLILNEYKYNNDYYNTKTLRASTKIDGINGINLEGYKRLYEINEDLNQSSQKMTSKNFSTFQFDLSDYSYIRGNIEPLIEKYKQQSESDFEEFFKNNNEYIVSDESKIILKYFYIKYDKTTGELQRCMFSGYILDK